MCYKDVVSKYSFLKPIVSVVGEEVEVSAEAVEGYCSYVEYKHGWVKNNFALHRNQITSKGAWLSREKWSAIDVSGDILTSKTAFKSVKEFSERNKTLYKLFVSIYHSKGNCIPWCEGGNLGGGIYKGGGSSDFFERKLMVCKEIFEQKYKPSEAELDILKNKIECGKKIGRVKKKVCIYYWLKHEWLDKGRCWNDFIDAHYLRDMVDDEYNLLSFIDGENVGKDLGNMEEAVIQKTLVRSIQLIIKRGYRIENGIVGEFEAKHLDVLSQIFNELEL